MSTFIQIVFFVTAAYVGIGVLYFLVFALAALLPFRKKAATTDKQAKIAVFIPGYKEDGIIYHVAEDALKQQYPHYLFDVIVIADSFDPRTIQKLKHLPIILNEVSFEKSTKAKSINETMGMLQKGYDIAVVLDADNLMAPNFLKLVNDSYQNGAQAMQGHRTAKNQDTAFARMDAMSEEINNNIFRKGHTVLGLPSALIGSAMAFDYQMYKEVMAGIDVVSGFDKELEVQLISRGIDIEYLQDALVYDEKVQSSEIFEKQRTRWLAAQVNFAKKYFFPSVLSLVTKGQVALFDKTLQFVILPRALTIAAMVILVLVSAIIPNPILWKLSLAIFAGFVLAMLVAIPKRFYNGRMLSTLFNLPKAIFAMLGSLLKINQAKNTFIHTPHSHVEAKNVD